MQYEKIDETMNCYVRFNWEKLEENQKRRKLKMADGKKNLKKNHGFTTIEK